MQIRAGFEMIYDCPQPTPMIFNLNVHFTRVSDLVGRDDVAARHDADESMVNWLVVIFWTLIILWIAYSIWSSARYASRAGGRGGGPIFLPGPGWGSGPGGSGWIATQVA